MKAKIISGETLYHQARNQLPIIINLLVLDALVLFFIWQQGNVLGTSTGNSCPQACINLINQKSTTKSTAKESVIALGAGTNMTDEWTDVTGVQTSIDTTQYGRIKEVKFEASIYVPTGNQKTWVRLYNASDRHPVWYSELTMDGTGPTLLTSPPVALDSGNKTYQVQMKSQLKFRADLVVARLRITTY